MKDRYINPFTDFGFKKLFGTEANKDLLIDFLNCLLEGKETIVSLHYKNNENLGASEQDRKAIFDLYCENEKGEKFIIELQKTKQKFFKDRSLYYATFPIQEQAQRGEWDFELKAVYLVAILDFVFDHDQNDLDKFKYEVQLMDKETCQVFYDKLSFIYLEMPKFTKSEMQLETRFEKWIYALKFLPNLEDRPKILREKIFKKLFQIAEISNLKEVEKQSYESSLKYYRDLKNSLDTAREEGKEEGKLEMARNLLQNGVDLEIIQKASGLSLDEIKKL